MPDYDKLTAEKRRLIDLLLDRDEGDLAVSVYQGEDPAEIRLTMKQTGVIDDDDVAEALWDWVARATGAETLI